MLRSPHKVGEGGFCGGGRIAPLEKGCGGGVHNAHKVGVEM